VPEAPIVREPEPEAVVPSQFISQAPPDAPQSRRLYLEDEEPAVPPRPAKSRSWLWVMLVMLLAGGVGVALGWPSIAPMLGLARAEDPAMPFIEAGDAALAQDDAEGYERANEQYTQALAHGDTDPRVLTRLSRAHALWAQLLAFDASDAEALAAQDPAARGRADTLRADVARHANIARQRGEDAVRHGSSDAEAQAALADAMRLTSDLAGAQSHLSRALTLQASPSAETLRVAALIDAAAANGDLSAARAKAEEAVAEDPGLIRARLLCARALLASNDVGAARQQVERILSRTPQHGRAIALRDAIEEGRPPAPPTVVIPDGGLPDAGAAAAPTQPAAPAQQAQQGTAPPGTATQAPPPAGQPVAQAGGAPPAGRDYSWYLRGAEDRLDRRDLGGARQYYEAALRARPGGSEALTGLGNVMLEQGDANGAANNFRQAAQQGYGDAYIGLGAAYRRMGQRDTALRAYERYLERLPNGPRADVAQRAVDELRAQAGGSQPSPPEPQPPPSEPAPPSEPGTLPPPRGMNEPPPQDTPAVGTEQ
jgi:tetratricopeptide (TPR) repeat protein